MLLKRADLEQMLTAFAVLIATHLHQPSDPAAFQELATRTVTDCLEAIALKSAPSPTSELEPQPPAASSLATTSLAKPAASSPAPHSADLAAALPPPRPGLTPATAAIEKEKQALGLTTPARHIPVLPAPTRPRAPLPQRKPTPPPPASSETGARRKILVKKSVKHPQPWR